MDKTRVFGKHYLVEFTGCPPERLRRVEDIRPVLLEAVRVSGAHMLGEHFHQFTPEGVTGMVFIAESHFAIHTWPEDGYAAFDVLTCGVMDAVLAVDYLRAALGAVAADIRVLDRGF